MQSAAVRGIQFREPPIFERGAPGRSGASLPPLDVPAVDPAAKFGALARKIPAGALARKTPAGLLNANYLAALLRKHYPLAYDGAAHVARRSPRRSSRGPQTDAPLAPEDRRRLTPNDTSALPPPRHSRRHPRGRAGAAVVSRPKRLLASAGRQPELTGARRLQ